MDSELSPDEIAAEHRLAIVGNMRHGYGLRDLDDGRVWLPAETCTDPRKVLRAFVDDKGSWS